jgi:hypothetical protein
VGKPPPRVDGATCRQAANGGQGACQQQVAPHSRQTKHRATSISPIPQTLTFQSTDKRHFGQSLSLACNTRAQRAPSFKTQARTYFHSTLFNPLNAELNPICHSLALVGARPIFHVSRIRVKLIGVQGDTQSLRNEPRTSPQRHHHLVCQPRNVTAHKTAILVNVFQQPRNKMLKIHENNFQMDRQRTYNVNIVGRSRNRCCHGNATLRHLRSVHMHEAGNNIRTVDCSFGNAIMGPYALLPQLRQVSYCGRSSGQGFNLYEPCVLYIERAYRYPPNVAFYIFFFNNYKY